MFMLRLRHQYFFFVSESAEAPRGEKKNKQKNGQPLLKEALAAFFCYKSA